MRRVKFIYGAVILLLIIWREIMEKINLKMPNLNDRILTDSIDDLMFDGQHPPTLKLPEKFIAGVTECAGCFDRYGAHEHVGEYVFNDGIAAVVRTFYNKWDPTIIDGPRIERRVVFYNEKGEQLILDRYSSACNLIVSGRGLNVEDARDRLKAIAYLLWSHDNYLIENNSKLNTRTKKDFSYTADTVKEFAELLSKGRYKSNDKVETLERVSKPYLELDFSYNGVNVYVHRFDKKKKVGEEERRVHGIVDKLIPDQEGIIRGTGGGSILSKGEGKTTLKRV